ncbi:Electron transfer flavoprotein-ubiquinone oxidoreductase [Leminorella richardii]|uniref:Protein FixC n=1 Tax=Leminorella richardii TaxID=158841 RepID=A0A2X4V7Q4_9GAMM|nr:FAD-dependent oxidoreductase [Leminorella richardii]SQI42752.1 Electron transfer flavoprotein-ubiquinone oxidoreductase [Leminorella richardii]
MHENEFDVIVIGGGIAGSSCALQLARAGISVLLLERGAVAGSKNLSGGRLYAYSLASLIPDFAQSAPLERQITREKLSMLTQDSAVTLDYQHPPFAADATSYSVLRARFDPWLMAQAEQAGAQCLTGVQVDGLIVEQGVVKGVTIGEDRLYASAVVLAEGANTLLGERHGLISKPAPDTMAIGVKQTLALPSDEIEARFALRQGEGAAWMLAGAATKGQPGGGFLYTNRDTLSFGVVCPLAQFDGDNEGPLALLENLKAHPSLNPLLKGAEVVEYGARLIPEGGLNSLPALSGAGYVVVGDAARLCLNCGHTVRGMDLAILSAQAAAQTLIDARHRSDFSTASLGKYQENLETVGLWALLKRYQRLPDMLLETPRLFTQYPKACADLMRDLYEISSRPGLPLRSTLWKHARRIGLMNLIKDLIRGGRCL